MPYVRRHWHFIILWQLIRTIISKIKMPVRYFNASFVLYRWLACAVCLVLRTQQRWLIMFSWMDHLSLGPVQQRPSAVWTHRPWPWPLDTLCKFRLNVSLFYFSSRLWNSSTQCICVAIDIYLLNQNKRQLRNVPWGARKCLHPFKSNLYRA